MNILAYECGIIIFSCRVVENVAGRDLHLICFCAQRQSLIYLSCSCLVWSIMAKIGGKWFDSSRYSSSHLEAGWSTQVCANFILGPYAFLGVAAACLVLLSSCSCSPVAAWIMVAQLSIRLTVQTQSGNRCWKTVEWNFSSDRSRKRPGKEIPQATVRKFYEFCRMWLLSRGVRGELPSYPVMKSAFLPGFSVRICPFTCYRIRQL